MFWIFVDTLIHEERDSHFVNCVIQPPTVDITHSINVWYIHIHLLLDNFHGKYTYHTWILWVCKREYEIDDPMGIPTFFGHHGMGLVGVTFMEGERLVRPRKKECRGFVFWSCYLEKNGWKVKMNTGIL